MTTEKRIWPIWSILVIVLIVVIAVLIPLAGVFTMIKYKEDNQQEFRMACVEATGTWSQDVCVIK